MKRWLLMTLAAVVGGGLWFSQTAQAQDPGVASSGYKKVFSITENPDSLALDAVAQIVMGGLDLNKNEKQEFLYATDQTFTGGRHPGSRGYSLFLYEYDPVNTTYAVIWKYTITDTVGGSFPIFTIGDLDSDGNQEVILGVQYGANLPRPGANPDRLLIFEFGAGPLPTGPAASWNFDAPAGSSTRASALIAGDIDGDNRDELAVAFRLFSGIAKGIVIVSVDGDFAGPLTTFKKEVYDTTTVTASGSVSIIGTARITDLDNDGQKEATFVYGNNGLAFIYEATAPDTYTQYNWDLKQGTGLTNGPLFSLQQADIDNNASNELIFGRSTPPDLYVISDITDLAAFDSSKVHRLGRITNHSATPTTINEFRGLAAGDFDDDGKTDMFMCNGGRVWRVEYKGAGAITDSANYDWNYVYEDTTAGTRFRWASFTGDTWAASQGVSFTDMDGNGNPELLIANQRGGSPTQGSVKIVLIETDTGVGVEETPNGNVPSTFRLEQNYPNPFNPSTTIRFSLFSADVVRLEVFDLLGRKVATLVNGKLVAGDHRAVFDATGLSSGTYVYMLRVGNRRASKLMQFLK